MKRYFQIILISLFIGKVEAQVVFCPPGAEWHFTFFAGQVTNSIVNETIKYGKDSASNNENFKILYHKRFFRSNNNINVTQSLLKQKGDTVFIRNYCTDNNWQILYNFAALPAQKWNIVVYPYFSSPSFAITYTVSVDSMSSVNINNFNLKRLYVKYSSYSHSTAAIITERLGCETFLFNYRNTRVTDGDFLLENLCYQDSVFGLKQFTEKLCNYTDKVGFMDNAFENSNIKIHPNPMQDFVTIRNEDEVDAGNVTIIINDLWGKEIKKIIVNDLNSNPAKIDVVDLPPGIYMLSLTTNNKVIYSGKLLKTD